jgi:UDP-N-acetylglucosamine:LPS N-acetylglucosamine transferase
LVPEVKMILLNPQILAEKKQAMRSLAVPDAAEQIAEMILEQATRKGEVKND